MKTEDRIRVSLCFRHWQKIQGKNPFGYKVVHSYYRDPSAREVNKKCDWEGCAKYETHGALLDIDKPPAIKVEEKIKFSYVTPKHFAQLRTNIVQKTTDELIDLYSGIRPGHFMPGLSTQEVDRIVEALKEYKLIGKKVMQITDQKILIKKLTDVIDAYQAENGARASTRQDGEAAIVNALSRLPQGWRYHDETGD